VIKTLLLVCREFFLRSLLQVLRRMAAGLDEVIQNAFLMVWMTGWTLGGTAAWSMLLDGSIAAGVFAVWLVLTLTFASNISRACQGPLIWFLSWLALSAAAISIRFITSYGRRLALKLDRLLLRFRYFLSSMIWWRRDDPDPTALLMITVSMQLISGTEWTARVFSHDYAATLREEVERRHGLGAGSGRHCQLVLGTEVLVDAERLIDAGVQNGSNISVIITEKASSSEVPAPLNVRRPPNFAVRGFMLVWLCGWMCGEYKVATLLENEFLGCE